MNQRRRASIRGVTLLEVTIAVAILAAVLGVSAQVLMQFYVSLDVQRQRVEAVNTGRAVLGACRQKREEFTHTFPVGFLQWVTAQNNVNWPSFTVVEEGDAPLREHRIVVSCLDAAGEAAGPNTVPLYVHVTSTWNDARGRPVQTHVATVLAGK